MRESDDNEIEEKEKNNQLNFELKYEKKNQKESSQYRLDINNVRMGENPKQNVEKIGKKNVKFETLDKIIKM
ncbi:hypothetical protein BpHYR1_006204 [Brachionus plicatilis]|uniref:Uncharacterized protein n=1 Tax=Brachionus plicatilis TaxID=10195 RepID=A0A3M7R424_BRAPC|nr:hypothetical protein BpHYR1_006204 [Brachionus plicatilis]